MLSKRIKMKAVVYSNARNNLRNIINDVNENCEEYIITTKDNKQAVLISYEEYSAMKETMYLLSSKNNRQRLLKSIEDVENMKIIKKDL